MKKLLQIFIIGIMLLNFAGCGSPSEHEIEFVVPAGNTEIFLYSQEEFSSLDGKITVCAGEGISDTQVVLSPVDENQADFYRGSYLTRGMPAELEVSPEVWFKLGVSVFNSTEEDQRVSLVVKGAQIRIS